MNEPESDAGEEAEKGREEWECVERNEMGAR